MYFFSLYRSPRGVINELERLRCRFFWGGRVGEGENKGLVWVKWSKTVESFSKGGLNIGGLQSENWGGLMGKWWWRFLVEKKCILGPNY